MVTAEKSRRIAKFAFDYATKHGRKRVCSSKFERGRQRKKEKYTLFDKRKAYKKFDEVKLFLIGLEFIRHDSTKIKSNFRRQTIERVIAVKIGKDKLPS